MLRRARWVLLVLAVGLVVGLCGWLQAWLDWGNGPTRGGPPGEIWAYAPHEAAHAAGVVIDVAEVNRAAIERIRASQGGLLVVVPGFTAVTTATPVQLDPVTVRRLERAVDAWKTHGAVAILVSGGNVHPADTPFNEAWEMRAYLLEKLGVPAESVVVEPYARHSTTNLRNAGRFMRAFGIDEALVVTDPGQGLYFGLPGITSFSFRCERELGYRVGALVPGADLSHIRFRPAPEVSRGGSDPLDP